MINRETIITEIKEARELLLSHKDEPDYTENNAWYYLGVFDTLFGILDPSDKTFTHSEGESLTEYLVRVLDEYFEEVV